MKIFRYFTLFSLNRLFQNSMDTLDKLFLTTNMSEKVYQEKYQELVNWKNSLNK